MQLNPSEISDLIKKRIDGFEATSEARSEGTIVTLTDGITRIHGLADEGEDILVHSVPRVEALRMVAEDRIPNGHTLIALQWLQIHGDSLRERWC